ncbi:MAG TPA: hypothetical protein VMU11_04105 [Verrucomicrobiae bacterium]|nr:hypothetical protein [Verrucomicrobiae bacterium]
MKPTSNIKARQLSSIPTTHRESTLRAIGSKAHSIDSRIEHLAVEGRRIANLIKQAPGHGSSRLDWLHKQLNAN